MLTRGNRLDERDQVYALLQSISHLSDDAPVLEAPEGVECVARFKDGQRYLFVINRRKESVTLPMYGVGVYKEG